MSNASFTRYTVPFYTLAFATAAASFAKPAAACSCAEEVGFNANVPADGAEGVPTNVVLLASVGYSNEVLLVDEDDNEVAVTKEHVRGFGGFCSNSFELTPTTELLANHTYRMVTGYGNEDAGTSDSPTTVTFTTGDGPAAAASAPAPSAKLAVFDATNYQNSCVYSTIQGCLVTESTDILEVHVTQAGETDRYVGGREVVEHLELGDPAGEVCISVHSRDLAGHLSEPLERCFDANTAYEIPQSEDADIYPNCDHPAIQALLNDETPPEPDAGPTSNQSPADGGPTSAAPSADAGPSAPPGDSNDVADTSADIAPPPAVDSGRPVERDAAAESDDDENPIAEPESDDSGCSVGPSQGQHSYAVWAAVLGACTVLLRRRKVNGR